MSADESMQAWLQANRPADEERAAFADAEALLRGASPLTREYCPSREDLVAPEAALGASLVAARTRHLSACPLCQSDLADFRALTELAPEPALSKLSAALTLVWDAMGGALQALESGLAPAPVPALALRGEAAPASAVSQVAALGEGELRLTWALGSSGVDLLAEASGAGPLCYRLDLALAPQKGLVESRSADAEGKVRILGLEPGRYLLSILREKESEPALEVELDLRRQA